MSIREKPWSCTETTWTKATFSESAQKIFETAIERRSKLLIFRKRGLAQRATPDLENNELLFWF